MQGPGHPWHASHVARRVSTPWALVGAEENGKLLKLAFAFGDGYAEDTARVEIAEAAGQVTIRVSIVLDDAS